MVAATPVASSSSLRYGPNVPASLSPTTSTLAGFSADGGTTGGAVGAGVVGGTVGAGTVDVVATLPSGAPVDVGGETTVGVVESGAEPSATFSPPSLLSRPMPLTTPKPAARSTMTAARPAPMRRTT